MRGVLFEPVDADADAAAHHVVLTEPGAVWGTTGIGTPRKSRLFGPPACIRRESGIEEIQVPMAAPEVRLPAWHFARDANTGDRLMVVIAFSDQVHDRQRPDVVPDIPIGTLTRTFSHRVDA